MNFDRLQEISGGDIEFEREILKAFVEDARSHIEALKLFLADNDYMAVSDRAHQLKGASANLGVTTMQEVAAKLDRQAKQQDLSDATAEVATLAQMLQEVEDYLTNTL